MLLLNSLLFCILLLLAVAAVISFNLFVIKPFHTRWAINHARAILGTGSVASKSHFHSVYRALATARNDLEAAKLWKKLDELKDLAGIPAQK